MDKMDYTEEDREDKKYKKGYSKKEFKKDVAEAVEPVVMNRKKKKRRNHQWGRQPFTYAKMSATELRKLLNTKKKALLKKAGFPEGGDTTKQRSDGNLVHATEEKKMVSRLWVMLNNWRYHCTVCGFHSSNKTHYHRHLKTKKHFLHTKFREFPTDIQMLIKIFFEGPPARNVYEFR